MGIDLTAINIIVLAGNMFMSAILVYYYRFRAKIEEKQTEIQRENAEARKCLRDFRRHVRVEREEILKMSKNELEEFVDELEHLGEE